MPGSTVFVSASTATGLSGNVHVTDGSRVTLVIEGTTVGFMVNLWCPPGLDLEFTRASTTCKFQWRQRTATWQDFDSGDATFTVPAGETITAHAIDP